MATPPLEVQDGVSLVKGGGSSGFQGAQEGVNFDHFRLSSKILTASAGT